MNGEDVLRMAREAGATEDRAWSASACDVREIFKLWPEELEKFAAAIRSATKEEDAKRLDEAADRLLAPKRTNEVDRHTAFTLQGHANAIRASK